MIPNPAAIHAQKSLLLIMILDYLKENTTEQNPVTVECLRRKIEDASGFMPARNTIYGYLDTLELAGFPIGKCKRGIYYSESVLTDGQVRFLADSVLYSDFLTKTGAEEILDALAPLGSPELQKYIKGQKARVKWTRKGTKQNIYLIIEKLQTAITTKKQIRFNYLTYREDLTAVPMYDAPLTVHPYQMVYKNGRYYLIGAVDGNEQISTWRIERIDQIEELKTPRIENTQIKEIMRSGDISKYVEAQPDLCGGKVETFKLQCSNIQLDDIVDAFGNDIRIVRNSVKITSPDVVILSVSATRESMRAWAMAHVFNAVILEPEDMREEIMDMLHKGFTHYHYADKSTMVRSRFARSIEEAVRMAKLSEQTELTFHAQTHGSEMVRIDSSLFEGMPQIEWIRFSYLAFSDKEFLSYFPNLKILMLRHCEYDPTALQYAPGVTDLTLSECDDVTKQAIIQMKELEQLSLDFCDVSDLSFLKRTSIKKLSLSFCDELTNISCLSSIPALNDLYIHDCKGITDYSFLSEMKNLKILDIESLHFNYEDAKRLQEQLPDCKIHARGYNDEEDFI